MIYLFHGPNTVDLDERIAGLRTELDPTGFGTTTVDLNDESLDEVQAAINATPFFGGQRVVVVRGAAAAPSERSGKGKSGRQTLTDVIGAVPSFTTLVIRHESALPSNSRLIKAVREQQGEVEAFPMLRGRELLDWTIDRARLEGVPVEQSAAERLLECLYPADWNPSSRDERYAGPIDMRLIATEVTKLATAAYGETITEKTVEELVEDRSGYTAFKLNDDVYEGRSERAMVELEQVLASGEQPERILAQVAREGLALSATRRAQDYDHKSVASSAEVSAGQLGFMLRNKSGWRNAKGLRRSAEEVRRAEWLVKTGRTQRTETVIVPLIGTIAEEFKSALNRRPGR